MSKFNSSKIEMTQEVTTGITREMTREIAQVPPFTNREIGRLLRSASLDFHEAIRILDSSRQSEAAGRLHALSVELREIAAVTDTVGIDSAVIESEQRRYLQ